jgi:hypothetical protein
MHDNSHFRARGPFLAQVLLSCSPSLWLKGVCWRAGVAAFPHLHVHSYHGVLAHQRYQILSLQCPHNLLLTQAFDRFQVQLWHLQPGFCPELLYIWFTHAATKKRPLLWSRCVRVCVIPLCWMHQCKRSHFVDDADVSQHVPFFALMVQHGNCARMHRVRPEPRRFCDKFKCSDLTWKFRLFSVNQQLPQCSFQFVCVLEHTCSRIAVVARKQPVSSAKRQAIVLSTAVGSSHRYIFLKLSLS